MLLIVFKREEELRTDEKMKVGKSKDERYNGGRKRRRTEERGDGRTEGRKIKMKRRKKFMKGER